MTTQTSEQARPARRPLPPIPTVGRRTSWAALLTAVATLLYAAHGVAVSGFPYRVAAALSLAVVVYAAWGIAGARPAAEPSRADRS